MGDVMKESATIAFTYVRHIAEKYGIEKTFFETNAIHLHIPEGATPKDGPSAGITMACSLFSLASNRVIKPALAMTGELSLAGKVMPIGGLKEKVIAARRNRIKTIIIPKYNERDLEEIPEHIRSGLEFYPVDSMEQVLDLAFGLDGDPSGGNAGEGSGGHAGDSSGNNAGGSSGNNGGDGSGKKGG
jgi:ATP-dependent Lon protease